MTPAPAATPEIPAPPALTARERFLRACRREPVDRPPLWLMRQAGRYLPEYRALKERHGFLGLVRTPELAAEVTLQPLRRFGFDAAILFSDILVIPEALGQSYRFRDEGGIEMAFRLDDPARLADLTPGAVEDRLSYVFEALRLLRGELGGERALLGFAGSPWTLAGYMIAGGSSDDFAPAKTFATTYPEAFQRLLDLLADALGRYLRRQCEAGADAVQIFDSNAALCPAARYEEWSLAPLRRVLAALPAGVPAIIFARGMEHRAGDLARSGASVLSAGWHWQLSRLQDFWGGALAVQGNLDPALLLTRPEAVRAATREILGDMGRRPGHVFNLGHGMPPGARLDCVEALCETVQSHRS